MFYETVIEKQTRQEYQVLADKTGENPQPCPACSHDRKKKNVKCLSYNSQKQVGHCSHCGATFYKKEENQKTYKRPEWTNKTDLSDKLVEWFLKRNISQDVLKKMKVTEQKEWMPQVNAERNVICFNYFRDGQLINTKYRDGAKNFKMFKDAEKIFYNIDALKANKEVYIVEGEIDCLTLIQAGHENVISVPNGAVKGTNNLDYLDNCWKDFEGIERVYIATDHDEPGENLAKELARRIGVEKCFRVNLGFKDANDQYCQTGALDLSNLKPFPIEGIFGIDDHWDGLMSILTNGFPKGWKPRGSLGKLLSFHPGYNTTIVGIPGSGKSEVLDQILIQLCIDYDLRGGYFTPENWPSELHLLKIIEKMLGKSAFKANQMELAKARDFIRDRIFWIYPSEGYGLEQILEKVRQAVMRYGIQWYVIDPWNKLEHLDDSTGYVGRCLDLISNFNKKNGTHSFIVAHPTKMRMMDNGQYEVPNLYSISGSANFYNKTDIGLSMYKEEKFKNSLIVQKVKFKYWGEGVGKIDLSWNPENGRYDEIGTDLTNWIIEKGTTELISFSEPKYSEEPPF